MGSPFYRPDSVAGLSKHSELLGSSPLFIHDPQKKHHHQLIGIAVLKLAKRM